MKKHLFSSNVLYFVQILHYLLPMIKEFLLKLLAVARVVKKSMPLWQQKKNEAIICADVNLLFKEI